ncbi:MAG: ABC transporter ATP-binding protein [Candidatus Sericytochromatia bacterium]|nr:ABC transporter ATP-binding protein [Candidatus Sericytochromatia bacterium]
MLATATPDHLEGHAAPPPLPLATPAETVRLLVGLLPQHVAALTLAALFVVLGTLTTAALVPLARAGATAFGQLSWQSLNGLVAGLIGLFALRSLCQFVQSILAHHVALAVTSALRERVTAHLLELEMRAFQRIRPSDVTTRLTDDLEQVRDALAAVLAEVIPSVLVIAYAIGTVTWMNWRLALASLLGAPLVSLAIARFGSRLHHLAAAGQARQAALAVETQEALQQLPLIRVFGHEGQRVLRLASASQAHRRALWRKALVLAAQSPTIAILQTSALAAVLWVGGREILHGRLEPADLLAFAAAIGIAVDPTLALSQTWSRVQMALASARRVAALQTWGPTMAWPEHSGPTLNLAGDLTCHHVSVTDSAPRPILQDISLRVRPGECLVITGPSGAGKSTLAALLVRLCDPSTGEVRLGSLALSAHAREDLRRAIAYVPQAPTLLAGSVAENLRLGKPEADLPSLRAACRIAQIDDFIDTLPHGYETRVGEGGLPLSGGQVQRLALARAQLVQPRIWVLDEATSALDPQLTTRLLDALLAQRDCMWVLVSHQPEVVWRADQVAVLEQGKLVQLGPPRNLVDQPGLFSELYRPSQFKDTQRMN